MQTKVAFVDVKDVEEKFLNEHKPDNCEFIYIKKPLHEDIDSIIDQIKDADILSIFTSSRAPAEILSKFPNLKFICTRSTGFNNVDLDYCKQHNIPVSNVPRYGDCTVAEFAFGLLLNLVRNINKSYMDLKNGVVNVQRDMGHDLHNKKIGIIGTGAIGCHMARIARGFGMTILAYDPYPKETMADELGIHYQGLNEVLKEADIISIHAPSTKQNVHMINDVAFNLMKDGVYIINTARGEIIETEALYRALRSGKVAGAGLDVLECEDILVSEDQLINKIDCINQECLTKTLVNHRLLDLPNVIVTPHVAFDTVEAIYRILNTTIGNIKGFLEENIQNKVN